MPISATQLDRAVQAWNNYAVERPREIKPRQLLKDRDASMYRGLGIESAPEFARALVEHRSAASLEMTMGHLFERLLEELGPTKVTNNEKETARLPGGRLPQQATRTAGSDHPQSQFEYIQRGHHQSYCRQLDQSQRVLGRPAWCR